MTVTSGRKCVGSWLPAGPLGVCLKMLLVTSAWASTKRFLTWRTKATPRNRLLFQLAPSMPRTDETEFGLLPTATTFYSREDWPIEKVRARQQEVKDATNEKGEHHSGNGFGLNLAHAARLWPTLTVGGGGQTLPEGTTPTGKTPDGRKQTVCLERAVKNVERGLWPTPIANDAEKRGIPKVNAGLAGAVHMVPTPTTSMSKGSSGGGNDPQERPVPGERPAGLQDRGCGPCEQWSIEPDVGRVAHGVPNRVDRLRALGNAVVPQIPEMIGYAILEAERAND